MKLVLSFTTSKFDVTKEPPNEPNPIPGHSFLEWIGPELRGAGFEVDEPFGEDWGWCLEVRNADGRYFVGACAFPDEEPADPPAAKPPAEASPPTAASAEDPPAIDWIVQIWRTRSLGERLRGKGKMRREDALPELVDRLIRKRADATNIEVVDE